MDEEDRVPKDYRLGHALIAVAAICGALAVATLMTNIMRRMSKEAFSGAVYETTAEETVPFVFRPEDYPHYMPLDVQIQTLQSLGIETPDEGEMKQYRKWMEEDGHYQAYLEGTPFVGLLSEIGYGEYDEETEEYIYNPTVYWLDLEGWDISQDYIDILNAVQTMGGGEFELSGMEENCDNVNWDEGSGAILVMFRYNGTAYAFEALMEYDWIDPDIIGFLNEMLGKEKNPKRIYCMGDDGQGVILFYNTGEWAEDFLEKTGIKLEAPLRTKREPWEAVSAYRGAPPLYRP